MGRGIVESGLFRSERYGLETRTTDPATTQEGEAWIRTDVEPDSNAIAALRVDNGTGTWDIPIYQVGESTQNVSKALRMQVEGVDAFVPVVEGNGAYSSVRLQHNGSVHSAHDSLEYSPIPDSVVNRWPFDEGSGSTVKDIVGVDDGTISGATWTTGDGNGGYHLDFNGIDNYVETPAIPATGSANRTFAAWIKTSQTTGYISEYGTAQTQSRWAFWVEQGGTLRIEIQGAGYTSSLGVNTGAWEPVAVVLNGSTVGDHILYHDGVTENASGSTTVNTGSNSGAWFGRRFWESSSHFDGKIDDPIYWDRALSKSELDDWVAATQGNYS